MPIVNIRLSGEPQAATSEKVAFAVAELTHEILGKDRALTAISIVYVDPAHWFVGGQSLAKTKQSTFSLDIKVTDETNTKAEKARYVAAVFEAMKPILENLDEHSYVHVHDVRAATYGYGGKTQEHRYQKALLA